MANENKSHYHKWLLLDNVRETIARIAKFQLQVWSKSCYK